MNRTELQTRMGRRVEVVLALSDDRILEANTADDRRAVDLVAEGGVGLAVGAPLLHLSAEHMRRLEQLRCSALLTQCRLHDVPYPSLRRSRVNFIRPAFHNTAEPHFDCVDNG